MHFFTKEQYDKLLSNGQPENKDQDNAPVAKLFLSGTGFTWLISEIDPEEPDTAFGFCDLDMGCPELGYVSLKELSETHIGPFAVEMDNHFYTEYPMSVFISAANANGVITDDPFALKEARMNLLHTRKSRNFPSPR